MMTSELMVWACIILLLVTSLLHSVVGELMLINPLLKDRENHILKHSLARLLIRFVWHIATIMWVLLAVILYSVFITKPASLDPILIGIGISFVLIGVFDLIVSKGRHIGWPFLTLIGVTALLAQHLSS